MSAIRQDAWTDQDDSVLAEVTLRHIREGGTQLSAFAEVGQRIGRTQAACGFRWNSYLRKQFENEIKQAKQQRQRMQIDRRKLTLKRSVSERSMMTQASVSAADGLVLKELNELNEMSEQLQLWLSHWRELQLELTRKNAEIAALRKENEDYRTFMQILERARSISAQPQPSL